MELQDAIQKLAVEMPAYGYRRITAALRRGGLGGESQTSAAADARRQSALSAE